LATTVARSLLLEEKKSEKRHGSCHGFFLVF